MLKKNFLQFMQDFPVSCEIDCLCDTVSDQRKGGLRLITVNGDFDSSFCRKLRAAFRVMAVNITVVKKQGSLVFGVRDNALDLFIERVNTCINLFGYEFIWFMPNKGRFSPSGSAIHNCLWLATGILSEKLSLKIVTAYNVQTKSGYIDLKPVRDFEYTPKESYSKRSSRFAAKKVRKMLPHRPVNSRSLRQNKTGSANTDKSIEPKRGRSIACEAVNTRIS